MGSRSSGARTARSLTQLQMVGGGEVGRVDRETKGGGWDGAFGKGFDFGEADEAAGGAVDARAEGLGVVEAAGGGDRRRFCGGHRALLAPLQGLVRCGAAPGAYATG